MERTVLKAPIGFVYTDGTHYGRIIFLSIGATADGWELITESAYEEIQKQLEIEAMEAM